MIILNINKSDVLENDDKFITLFLNDNTDYGEFKIKIPKVIVLDNGTDYQFRIFEWNKFVLEKLNGERIDITGKELEKVLNKIHKKY